MQRLNKLTHDYFDVIDTEYKAYILGFIFADGCIVDNFSGRQKSLRIEIIETDGYILLPLIKDVQNKDSYRYKYTPSDIAKGHSPKACVSINSDQLCEKIIDLGCKINKTILGLDFPNIDKDLIRHFIRGFFDGDGCITANLTKNTYTRVSTRELKKPFSPKVRKRIYLVNTDLQFLQDVISNIESEVPFEGKLQWSSRINNVRVHKVGIEHQKDVQKVKDYLYKDATIFLKRKFDKFNMTISSLAGDTSSEGSETT